MQFNQIKKGSKIKCLFPLTIGINKDSKGYTQPINVFISGEKYEVKKNTENGLYLRYQGYNYYFKDYPYLHNQFSL